MSLFGELRTVDDVPGAFAALLTETAPRSVALSGGSTAQRCYRALDELSPDWSGVSVYYGDERWVGLDDPDSNAGMVHRTLAVPIGAATEHPMFNGSLTIDEGAAAYGRLLEAAGPVDFVHLGMGPDGHTCSLFPGSTQLNERRHRVVPAGDDHHPHPRLTVTYPWLETARLVVFTVSGNAKRDALTRVRTGEQLPAGRVRAQRVIWLADPAATG